MLTFVPPARSAQRGEHDADLDPRGPRRLAEGAETAGRRVTIVEDVVTTGGQIVLSTADLRALGAEIADALCVINRNPSTPAALTEAGLTLHALLTSEDLTPDS